MYARWIPIWILCLSAPLLAGPPADGTAAREVVAFPGSTVLVTYTNPDPSHWSPYDLGNASRPGLLNRNLRHSGIRDLRGVDVRPVMSLTLWKIPDDSADLAAFAKYLLARSPFHETDRELKEGRLYLTGTTSYGGYTHIIRRALSYSNQVGLDLICDATDTVYPGVQSAFEAWVHGVQMVPRITPERVLDLPKVAPEPPDEVVTTSIHQLEKQQPGGVARGAVAGIKDDEGMSLFWNASRPYFRLRVEGRDFAGYDGGEAAAYTADGAFFQVQSTPVESFGSAPSLKDPKAILQAHRDWEFQYLQQVAGEPCTLNAWSGTLPDGSPVLYWEAVPAKVKPGGPRRHVFCTRYQAGSVIVVGSVEEDKVSLERARNLVYFAIASLTFSKEPFDLVKVQKELASRGR